MYTNLERATIVNAPTGGGRSSLSKSFFRPVLTATLNFDHDNQVLPNERAGRRPLLAERRHRCP